MSPITHFLGSWAIADATRLSHRDRSLITLSGFLPDLDGAGALIDLANRMLGHPEAFWYNRFHHFLLHGLPGALFLAFAAACFAGQRVRVFLMSFAVVHLHIFCDLVGSRGPYPEDIWPVHYLGPFSNHLTLQWQGQWPLEAWPNVAATLILLAYVFYRIVSAGRSPVSMFNDKAHREVVSALRKRWGSFRGAVSVGVDREN